MLASIDSSILLLGRSTMEAALDAHSSHPSLAPSYNPSLLRRTEALSSDIAHFLSCSSTSPAEWQRHPLYTGTFLPLPAPLAEYTSRLTAISQSSDPTSLLAHSYVRYLGDLSGGQFIKRMLAKAYGVDDTAMTFYEFRKLGSSETAGIGDMKKLKEWFKDAMDDGIGEDVHQKRIVVDEAQEAFRLNGALLDLLVAPPAVAAPVPMALPTVSDEKPQTVVVRSQLARMSIPLVGIVLALTISHIVAVADFKGRGNLLTYHFQNAARWFVAPA